MKISGVEGLTVADVQNEVRQGGKFVVFGYALSFLIITLKRSSDVVFIRPGRSAVAAGLPYTLLSLVLGWWGFPWGLIYTPMVLIQNLGGGKDVTQEVMEMFSEGQPPPPTQGLPPTQVL